MGIAFAAGKYVTWGVIDVSVTNLVIILVMVAVFVLALMVPFPSDSTRHRSGDDRGDDRRGRGE